VDGSDVVSGAAVTLTPKNGVPALRGGYRWIRRRFDGIGDRSGRNCPFAHFDETETEGDHSVEDRRLCKNTYGGQAHRKTHLRVKEHLDKSKE
jgi:hypothetical protein